MTNGGECFSNLKASASLESIIDGKYFIRQNMLPSWLHNTQSHSPTSNAFSLSHPPRPFSPTSGIFKSRLSNEETPQMSRTPPPSPPSSPQENANDAILSKALLQMAPHVCPNIDDTLNCAQGAACSFLHPSPSFRKNRCRHFDNGRCERGHRYVKYLIFSEAFSECLSYSYRCNFFHHGQHCELLRGAPSLLLLEKKKPNKY